MEGTSSNICWICKTNSANSGEHIIQARDLKDFLPEPSKPFYFHSKNAHNLKVQSVKSDLLKFEKVICHDCNSTLTQPHDRAWEVLSNFMTQHTFSAGNKIKFNKIFPYDSKKYMKRIHLHFVKKMGCVIAKHNIPIDIDSFSASIREEKIHTGLYLGFATRSLLLTKKSLGISDFHAWEDNMSCVYAHWFFFFENYTMMVIYAKEGENREGQRIGWNPRYNTNRIQMHDFDDLCKDD